MMTLDSQDVLCISYFWFQCAVFENNIQQKNEVQEVRVRFTSVINGILEVYMKYIDEDTCRNFQYQYKDFTLQFHTSGNS